MKRSSRPSFFYGWIVAACAFAVMFTAYGVQYAFGVFFPAILEEFGWSRASLGIFAVPPLAALLISRHGWRLPYLLLGAATLILLNVLARFMYRDPGELRLRPDGDPWPATPLKPTVLGGKPEVRAVEMDLSGATRTPAFWCLTASIVAALFTIPIPYVHLVSHAQGLGLSALVASTFVSVIGAAALAGNLFMGPVSDRIGRKATLGTCMFLGILAFLGFGEAQAAGGLYASATAFGFYYGAVAVLFPRGGRRLLRPGACWGSHRRDHGPGRAGRGPGGRWWQGGSMTAPAATSWRSC